MPVILDSTALAPVLDEALGLAEEALLALQTDQEKIATKDRDIVDLRRQLADQEKVILEKVAKTNRLNPVDLDLLFDRLEDLQIMSPKERTKLASLVMRDPNLIVPLFMKAADKLSGAPAEGGGVSLEDFGATKNNNRNDDDGWEDFCNGRDVRIK